MSPAKILIRRARLYQTLATALEAGLGIDRALDLASERPQHNPVHRLSDVLRRENRIPKLEAQVLSAAETAGVLPEVLRQLAGLLETQAAALRKLTVGLLYPFLLLHAAVVLPNVRWLVLGDLGDFLGHIVPALAVLWGLGAGAVVTVAWCRTLLCKSPGFATVLRGLPVVGGLIQNTGSSAYAYLLSMLLAAGVPLSRALKDSAECCGNAELQASGLRISERVDRQGESLSTAFQTESRAWPRLLIEAVRTGETAGRLEETLAGVAKGLREETARRAEVLLTVVPILVYLGAAIYVAWVIISNFVSVYSAI